jgi:hypothetical protein
MRSSQPDSRDGREDRGLDDIGEGEFVPVQQAAGGLEALTRGEVDVQVATAKRYPRNLKLVLQTAESMATIDEETAASCFYVLPRKRKDENGKMVPIEGPSVRLAEIIASSWGNMRCQARIIEEGDTLVTAQGVAWDLERNVAIATEVVRRITDREGRRYSEDMVAQTSNAAASIAFRNAVYRTIPRAYVNRIYNAAKRVAVGDAKTLVQRRVAAMEWWAKTGITQDRVLLALERKGIEEVDLGDLEKMLGWRTAVKEGRTKLDEIFPPAPMAEGTVKVGKGGQVATPPATPGAPATTPPPAAPSNEPPKQEAAAPKGSDFD